MGALKNKRINNIMSNREDVSDKIMPAIKNIKKLKIPLRISLLVKPNLNEEEIGEVLTFARERNFINSVSIRSYLSCGHPGVFLFLSDYEKEFLTDELVEATANQSKGLFTLEDVYYFQKIFYTLSVVKGFPACYLAPIMIIPRKKEKSLNETFRFEGFSGVLDEFEKIWREDRIKAEAYFFSRCLIPLIKNFPLIRFLIDVRLSKLRLPLYLRRYCIIFFTGYNSLLTCDINKIQQQCRTYSFDLGVENNIPAMY